MPVATTEQRKRWNKTYNDKHKAQRAASNKAYKASETGRAVVKAHNARYWAENGAEINRRRREAYVPKWQREPKPVIHLPVPSFLTPIDRYEGVDVEWD